MKDKLSREEFFSMIKNSEVINNEQKDFLYEFYTRSTIKSPDEVVIIGSNEIVFSQDEFMPLEPFGKIGKWGWSMKNINYSDYHFTYQVEVRDNRTGRLLGVKAGWTRRDTEENENWMCWRVGMSFEYEYKIYKCIEEHMDYKILSKERRWDNPDLAPPQ